MRLTGIVTAMLAGSGLAQRRSRQHLNMRMPEGLPETGVMSERELYGRGLPNHTPNYAASPRNNILRRTDNTTKFAVDGTKIPFVDFDVGESYAGLLPINGDDERSAHLYFWFFPSDNALAGDEILIWLNGGPGCSSLEGLLQENGPFSWQYGTYRPVANPWTWVNLTNVVWVEQPAGTGFSEVRDSPKVEDEIEVAKQFLGFWKNFVETFGLQGRKIFITGESYAGYYVPYIADAMQNETNKELYNIDSIQFNDPVVSTRQLQDQVPMAAFLNYWSHLLSVNDSFVAHINERADKCGFTAFMDKAMTFPPTGPLPPTPDVPDGCGVWGQTYSAAMLVNPCLDVYQIATTCPLLWDVLGFPGSFTYEAGPWLYFNRSDVRAAINAPSYAESGSWEECVDDVLVHDSSPPSAQSVLPRVIERNNRTLIAHGMLDMLLIANGTLMAIQNMTWSGAQGFSVPPAEWDQLYVPYHPNPELGALAGAGEFGPYHTERGLTFAFVKLSGHEIPQYQPSASYRMLEFLLGRIANLSMQSDFTTQSGNLGN